MKNILIIIFGLFFIEISAQHTINGVVKDQNQEHVEGANIYLKGTIDGATSNDTGAFSFETQETGMVTLIVSFLGYKDYIKTANITDLRNLKITLKEDEANLEKIVIKASSFSLGKSRTVEKMNALDIVMTGSSNGDIYAALQSMPGTQKVGEDGKLYIRGGDSRETQIFIDGMHVLAPYTETAENTPARSRFSPFLFKGINFSLGGYEPEYGQALSSVLPMYTKDVSGGTKIGLSISPLSIGGGGTYSFGKGKESISANIVLTNLDLYNRVLPDKNNWEKDYSKGSGQIQYKLEIGRKAILKIYSAYDKTMFVQNIQDELNNLPNRKFDLNQNNYYINSTYTTKTESGTKLFFGSAFSKVQNQYQNTRIQGDRSNKNQSELHLKSKITRRFSSFYKMYSGIETYLHSYQNKYMDSQGIERQNALLNHNIYAAFLDNQIKITTGLYANLSGRLEFSNYNSETNFSPRFSLNYIHGKLQFSGIVGKYFQSPEKAIMASNPIKLKQESAIHYIIGSSYNFDERLLRVEIYYKDYNHLSLLENGVYTSNGYGKSAGLDLYFSDNKSVKNFDYTFSFSYNDSKRLFKDYPVESTPLFSTNINTSLNLKYKIVPIKTFVGISNTFASGRPYHNPNKKGFSNSKTKSYNSLDMNLTFLLNKKVILYTSMTNVLGRENVFGYKYATLPNSDGIFESKPITASRDRFFYIGLFISLKNNAAYDVSNF